ncbi:hypothetical protein [Novipirellula sp.]|uniref:hypothetical protein n=1 Tax=Novipirellula sp. TaxID=2795430 RepID=UPI00356737C0
MNLASRIALIAYVVGGWLLPAMHHHAGHTHASPFGAMSSACCSDHDCEAASATPEVHHDDVSKCCHARDCDATETSASASDVAAQSDAFLYAVDSGNPEACLGLCALCAAQSLVGQTITSAAGSVGDIELVDRFGLTGIQWPLRVQRGGISSRGPPVIL